MSVDIANAALDRVYASPISSLEEKTKNADAVNRHLQKSAQKVLREVSWSEVTTNTCLKRIEVCDDCNLPDGFCYAFKLPKDFVTAYRVHEGCPCKTCCCNRDLDYRTKSRRYYERQRNATQFTSQNVEENWRIVAVTDTAGVKHTALVLPCPSAKLEYICLPEDLDTLPIDICIAVELMLAYRIAPIFKASSSLRQEIMQEYRLHMREAIEVSASQDQEEHILDEGDFVCPRLSVAGYFGGG